MDSVKTFFAGYAKDTTTNTNNNRQQNGFNGYHGAAMTARYDNDTLINDNKTKTTNQCDAKRKDSDRYFYIMWHS